MKVKCTKCSVAFALPDDKVPQGKTVRIACPRCGEKLAVTGMAQSSPSAPSTVNAAAVSGWTVRFDRLEEEGPRALLCLGSDTPSTELQEAISALGFGLRRVTDPDEAIEWWQQNRYRLVLIDEGGDPSSLPRHPLIAFSWSLPMRLRRNSIVCLLSRSIQTMDGLTAFRFGLDLILNRADVRRAKDVLSKAINDHRAAYLEFTKVGKEIGVL